VKGRHFEQSCILDRLSVSADISDPLSVIGISAKFHIDASLVVSAAAAMYQEQVLSYKHFDEPLDEGRFVFECMLAGNLQAFIMCRP